MPASIGVNLRVTGHCRQGGRKYMEDYFTVAYQQTDDEKDLEYAFFGIYDGHGGAEAAIFAKEHLMETIIRNKNFWSDDDEDVLRAIKEGYISTHYAMWREQEKWPKTASGLPSTAGTTASVAFIRRGKIYIGHVGDSGIILGYQDPDSSNWKARPLTRDHKPENAEEMTRIENCGGKVVAKSGVPRVVWNRPRIGHKGPVRRSTPIDEIPFLAVARSLGDLWSYNSALNRFVVSPHPDCTVLKIDTTTHRCLIFGTDGLYNMISPQMAVLIVQHAERHNEQAAMSDFKKSWQNPSKMLVEHALQRWHTTKMRADNTSAITLMLDPPGPPRAQVLKDRKKAAYPDRGLKIVTRYEDGDNSNCLNEAELDNQMDTTIEPETENAQPSTDENAAPIQKPPPVTCAPELPSVTSSDSPATTSTSFPLKERNFVPKPRESTSFDPRETRPSPDHLNAATDKENQSFAAPDDSIQIHEISSSSNDLEVCDTTTETEVVKHNLRSSSKPKSSPQVEEQHKNTKQLKRRCASEENVVPRKSMRLEDIQKNSPKWMDDRPKATRSSLSAKASKMSIAQKILKSKKLSFKKKDKINKNLTKSKIQLVLETVKRVQKKMPVVEKKPKEVKKPVAVKKALTEQRTKVVTGKLSNHFQRRSLRATQRKPQTGTNAAHKPSDKSAKIVLRNSKAGTSPAAERTGLRKQKPEKQETKVKTLRKQIQQKTATLKRRVISSRK